MDDSVFGCGYSAFAFVYSDFDVMTTIQDIFREIMPPEHSFSEARRQIHMDGVKFNGEQVTSMGQEVDVQDGSVFKVGKRATWHRKGDKWVRE